MVKKISNFTILSLTIIILLGVIIVASIVKISDNHRDKLLYSMQTEIEYYAKRCYLENNCEGVITLKQLYEKKYITDVVVNPVTKEIVDENLKIEYVDEEIVIDWN